MVQIVTSAIVNTPPPALVSTAVSQLGKIRHKTLRESLARLSYFFCRQLSNTLLLFRRLFVPSPNPRVLFRSRPVSLLLIFSIPSSLASRRCRYRRNHASHLHRRHRRLPVQIRRANRHGATKSVPVFSSLPFVFRTAHTSCFARLDHGRLRLGHERPPIRYPRRSQAGRRGDEGVGPTSASFFLSLRSFPSRLPLTPFSTLFVSTATLLMCLLLDGRQPRCLSTPLD